MPIRIVRMRKVSFIDSTGLHNLEIFIEAAVNAGQQVILSGVNTRVYKSIESAGIVAKLGEENVLDNIDLALARAEELAKQIDKAVFPGNQGGPLMHVIAAKAVCFGEALSDDFKAYGKKIVSNCKVLADALVARGHKLVSGGTDNHLMLADLRPMNITGAELQIRCDANHITLNKNAIPGDPQKPSVTSGVRIGTAAATTRGLGAEEMKRIAHCIALTAKDFDGTADEVKATVAAICQKYPMYK